MDPLKRLKEKNKTSGTKWGKKKSSVHLLGSDLLEEVRPPVVAEGCFCQKQKRKKKAQFDFSSFQDAPPPT